MNHRPFATSTARWVIATTLAATLASLFAGGATRLDLETEALRDELHRLQELRSARSRVGTVPEERDGIKDAGLTALARAAGRRALARGRVASITPLDPATPAREPSGASAPRSTPTDTIAVRLTNTSLDEVVRFLYEVEYGSTPPLELSRLELRRLPPPPGSEHAAGLHVTAELSYAEQR
jgi:hypothetical protein